jgi:O-antigen ligase
VIQTTLHRWSAPAFQFLCQLLWVGAVCFLPVTTLSLFPGVSGAPTVRPPSAALFLLLALVWLLPYILQKKRIPVEGIPLIFFAGATLVSWGLGFFKEVPSFRGWGVLDEAPQSFATLALAMAAYYVTSTRLTAEPDELQKTLRLVNLSGAVLLVWSLLQAYFVFFNDGKYPQAIVAVQGLFSTRREGVLFADRVTGFAYEPSWLAHQLNMLYLPLWLSSSLLGYTAHAKKLWKISVENILLVGGVLVLFASFSRVGALTFLLMLVYLSFRGTSRLVQRASVGIYARLLVKSSRPVVARLVKALLTGLIFVSIVALYILAAASSFYIGSLFEPRLARILKIDFSTTTSFLDVTNKLAFAERVIYWVTGLNIFQAHPLTGVGLGNAGLYFQENMPTFGWSLWEITLLFNYHNIMPNTKSLWVRILAETGLLGFAIFAGWYYLLWSSGKLVRQAKQPSHRMIGWATALILLGFLIEGFSVDSFALPYFWFSVGLLSGTACLVRRGMS